MCVYACNFDFMYVSLFAFTYVTWSICMSVCVCMYIYMCMYVALEVARWLEEDPAYTHPQLQMVVGLIYATCSLNYPMFIVSLDVLHHFKTSNKS